MQNIKFLSTLMLYCYRNRVNKNKIYILLKIARVKVLTPCLCFQGTIRETQYSHNLHHLLNNKKACNNNKKKLYKEVTYKCLVNKSGAKHFGG